MTVADGDITAGTSFIIGTIDPASVGTAVFAFTSGTSIVCISDEVPTALTCDTDTDTFTDPVGGAVTPRKSITVRHQRDRRRRTGGGERPAL